MKTSRSEVVAGKLDYLITDEEFDAALNKRKTNKAPKYWIYILNKVLKIGKTSIKRHSMNLFSRILNIYWQISHILAGVLASLYPYTKIDDQRKVENYSGITLFSEFRKLLTSILNNRSHSYMIEKRISKNRRRWLQKNAWHSWLHLYFNNDYWQEMENLSHRKNETFSFYASLIWKSFLPYTLPEAIR